MKFKLPAIYPITDCSVSGLSHLEQVKRLISGGGELIQLRDKSASPRDFYEAAAHAINFARESGVKIIVNDRVDIALTLRADGVHLGQEDLPPEHARAILGPDAIIGLSTHSFEQALAAISMPIDYVAIGPVFLTRTKSNPDKEVGLDGIKAVRAAIAGFPLVAIGGITGENLPLVLQSGADSAAMIGDLLSHPDKIESKLRLLLQQ